MVAVENGPWREFRPAGDRSGFVIQANSEAGQYQIQNSRRETLARIERGENGSMALFHGSSTEPMMNFILSENSVEVNFPNNDYQQINFLNGVFTGLHGIYTIPRDAVTPGGRGSSSGTGSAGGVGGNGPAGPKNDVAGGNGSTTGADGDTTNGGEESFVWGVMCGVATNEEGVEHLDVSVAEMTSASAEYRAPTGPLLNAVLTGLDRSLQMLGVDISPLIQRTREIAGLVLAGRSGVTGGASGGAGSTDTGSDITTEPSCDHETGLPTDNHFQNGLLVGRTNYDEGGNVQSRDRFTYDDLGNVLMQRYDADGHLVMDETRDADERLIERNAYDGGYVLLNETFQYDQHGSSVMQRRDNDGNLLLEERRNADQRLTGRTTYENGVRRSVEMFNSDGTSEIVRYDETGNRMVSKDRRNAQDQMLERFNYGADGRVESRLVATRRPDGSLGTIQRFDAQNRLVATTEFAADGKISRYVEHDHQGRPLRITTYQHNADGTAATTTRDAQGRVLSTANIDRQNRYTNVTYMRPDGTRSYVDNYNYDPATGRMASVRRVNADNSVDTFSYTYAGGRMATMDVAGHNGVNERHHFDANGRETRVTTRTPEGPPGQDGQQRYTVVDHRFNADGNISQSTITHADGRIQRDTYSYANPQAQPTVNRQWVDAQGQPLANQNPPPQDTGRRWNWRTAWEQRRIDEAEFEGRPAPPATPGVPPSQPGAPGQPSEQPSGPKGGKGAPSGPGGPKGHDHGGPQGPKTTPVGPGGPKTAPGPGGSKSHDRPGAPAGPKGSGDGPGGNKGPGGSKGSSDGPGGNKGPGGSKGPSDGPAGTKTPTHDGHDHPAPGGPKGVVRPSDVPAPLPVGASTAPGRVSELRESDNRLVGRVHRVTNTNGTESIDWIQYTNGNRNGQQWQFTRDAAGNVSRVVVNNPTNPAQNATLTRGANGVWQPATLPGTDFVLGPGARIVPNADGSIEVEQGNRKFRLGADGRFRQVSGPTGVATAGDGTLPVGQSFPVAGGMNLVETAGIAGTPGSTEVSTPLSFAPESVSTPVAAIEFPGIQQPGFDYFNAVAMADAGVALPGTPPSEVFSDTPPSVSALTPPALSESISPAVQNSLNEAGRLGVALPFYNVNEVGHHGINARYALQYLGGNEAQRRAALLGLQDQINNRDNNSAAAVLRDLMLFDSVRRLRAAAPGSREERQALLDLAFLDHNEDRAANPHGILDTHYPQGMPLEERNRRIESLRQETRELADNPERTYLQSVRVLTNPASTDAQRQQATAMMERVARTESIFHGQGGQARAYQNYQQYEQGMQLGQRVHDQWRGVMAGAGSVDPTPAQSLRGLVASQSPVAQHIRQLMSATPGGAALLAAASDADPSALERALNNPNVPPEMRGLLQGAILIDSLHQQLNNSSSTEVTAITRSISNVPGGDDLLHLIAEGRIYDASVLLAQTPLRQNISQAIREQQTLISLQRIEATSRSGMGPSNVPGGPPVLIPGNPASVAMVDAIAGTPAGARLIEAIRQGNNEAALEIIRNPGDSRLILNQVSQVSGIDAGIREIARSSNAGDFLRNFGTPEAIAAARAEARRWSEENLAASDVALTGFLARTATPGVSRAEALTELEDLTNARLARMGNTLLTGPFNWARSAHLATAVSEATTPAQVADALIGLIARSENDHHASRYLGAFGSPGQVEQIVAALRAAGPADTATLPVVRDMALIQSSTRGPEVAEAIGRLVQQAQAGNQLALRFLERITGQSASGAAAASDPSDDSTHVMRVIRSANDLVVSLNADNDAAYRGLRINIASPTEELNEQRTRRILRGIQSDSPPADYDARIAQLRTEAQAGNRQAADWLRWAEMSQQMAALNHAHEATDPQAAVRAAMQRLDQLAQGGNTYARQSLSLMLIGNSDAGRVGDFQAIGSGDVGPDRDHPIFIPDLRHLPASLQAEARRSAVDSLERQIAAGHVIGQQEAGALALALSEIERNPNDRDLNSRTGDSAATALDTRIRTILQNGLRSDGAQSVGRRDAIMRGIADIMRTDVGGTLGTSGLADLFSANADSQVFVDNFDVFNRRAVTGNVPALRVVATAAGGSRNYLSERAAQTLLQAGSLYPETVRDAMVHSYNLTGDRSRLLSTIGRVSAEYNVFNESVRAALRHGLERSLNPQTPAEEASALRRSALEGLMHTAQNWQARDVELITQRLTPELVEQLRQSVDRIPARLHRQFVEAMVGRLNFTTERVNSEAQYALEALRLFPRALTEENVNAIIHFGRNVTVGRTDAPPGQQSSSQAAASGSTSLASASEFQRQTAITLFSVMARGVGPAQEVAYRALGPGHAWHGIGQNDLREPLRNYALGRPMDLNLTEEVSRLIYDAGIPSPLAGVFRNVGMGGTDAEQFVRQEQVLQRVMAQFNVSREVAEQRVRQYITNVAAYNALPEAQRRAIAPGANGEPIDVRAVVGTLTNGRIFDADNPFNVMTQDIPARMSDLRQNEAAAVSAIESRIENLERQRLDALRAMSERTREGIDIWDRIGHVASRQYTLGFHATTIDRFEQQQASDVAAVRALEAQIQGLRAPVVSDLVRHQGAVTFLDFARDTAEWQRLMLNGQTREADILAVNIWGRYSSPQDFLQTHAPQIWTELTRVGSRPIDRGVFQRLNVHGMSPFETMPTFRTGQPAGPGGNPPSGFTEAMLVLRRINPAMADAAGVRSRAIETIDADPNFSQLVQASASFAENMTALFGDRERGITGMVEAGQQGTRYDAYVQDVRQRANAIQTALDSVPQSTVRAAIQQISELEAAVRGTNDRATIDALNQRITNLRSVVRIFDRESTENPSMRRQLERMVETVNSRRFDSSTFTNWLKNEGVIFAVAIAAAVATVATMGAASPLLVAVVASGVAIIASEATQELLYRTGSALGPGEPSRLGAYIDGRVEIDPATGRERPRTFMRDVLAPYAQQWAMDSIIMLATMGVGALGARGINALGGRAANFLARNSSMIARAQSSLQRLTTSAARSPVHRGWLRETLREFADEVGEEVAENMAESGLQRALGRNSEVLGFLASSVLAMRGGINFRRVSGTNIIGLVDAHNNPLTLDQTRDMVRSYEQQGARVLPRADRVSFEVRMPDGGVFILASQAHIRNTLPPAQLRPTGDVSASTNHHIVGEAHTPETQRLGDRTWTASQDSLNVRRSIQNFNAAMARGDYAEALRIANTGGVRPPADRVTQSTVDTRISAADLNNPDVLRDLLGRMQSAGQIQPLGDGRFDIRMPRPIVVLSSGASVDLTNSNMTAAMPARHLTPSEISQVETFRRNGSTGTVRLQNGVEVNLNVSTTESARVEPRALTAAEQQQVAGILQSEPGRRILQEQAFIAMEERLIHLSQLQLGGQVISPTYARFLSERAVGPNGNTPGDDLHSAFNGEGRSNSTYEQELVALLYDGGMSVADIEHHFGRQWASRAPVMDFIRRLEAGQPTTTAADRAPVNPLVTPVVNGGTLGRTETLARSIGALETEGASARTVAVLQEALNLASSSSDPAMQQQYLRAVETYMMRESNPAEFAARTSGDALLGARVNALGALMNNNLDARATLDHIFNMTDVRGIGRVARQGIERPRQVNHAQAESHARNGQAPLAVPSAQGLESSLSRFGSHANPEVRRLAADIQARVGDFVGQDWTRAVPGLLDLANTNPARAQEIMQVLNERMRHATEPGFNYSSPRVQHLADIMTTAGARPDLHIDAARIFAIPNLNDTALRHYSEMLRDAPPRPQGAGWDALRMEANTSGLQAEWRAYEAFTRALNANLTGLTELQNVVLVPSGHRSARDAVGMDFVAIDLSTGRAFPIDLKMDANAPGATTSPWALILSPGTGPSLNTVMTQMEQALGSRRQPNAADVRAMGTALNNFIANQRAAGNGLDLSLFHAGDAPPAGSNLFSFPSGRRLELPGAAQAHNRQLTAHDLMNFEAQLGRMLSSGAINQEVHDYLRSKLNEQFSFRQVSTSTGVLLENAVTIGATTPGVPSPAAPAATVQAGANGQPYLSVRLGAENPPAFGQRTDTTVTNMPMNELRIHPDGRVTVTGPNLQPFEVSSLQDLVDSVRSNPGPMTDAQHQQLLRDLAQLQRLDIASLASMTPAQQAAVLSENAGINLLRRGIEARDRQIVASRTRAASQSSPPAPLGRTDTTTGGADTAGGISDPLSAVSQILTSSLPDTLRGTLSRYAQAHPESAAVLLRASRLTQQQLDAAGIQSLLSSDRANAQRIELAVRHAEVLAGMSSTTVSTRMRSTLEQILLPASDRRTPSPRQVALAESMLRVGEESLPESVRVYLDSPNLIDADVIRNMRDDMRRVDRTEDRVPQGTPLTQAHRRELLREIFDDASGSLRERFSAEDLTRAQNEAARLLAQHMPAAVPESVTSGANQIVITLRHPDGRATVLKFDTRGPGEWRDNWGRRDIDARVIPFGEQRLHQLGTGANRWTAYMQDFGTEPEPRHVSAFNRQLRESGRRMGDGGPIEATASQIRVINGRPVLIDYDAVAN
jgi:hypothetical protein